MGTMTYTPIATTTLGSAASSITFSSIPATYTDLRLVFVGTATAADNLFIRYNGDTGANYSRTFIYGNGTSTASNRNTSVTYIIPAQLNGLSTTIPRFYQMDIFNYAGSTYKTSLSMGAEDSNGGSGDVASSVELWRSTSAINSILLFPANAGTTFKIGTTATLYGIKNSA